RRPVASAQDARRCGGQPPPAAPPPRSAQLAGGTRGLPRQRGTQGRGLAHRIARASWRAAAPNWGRRTGVRGTGVMQQDWIEPLAEAIHDASLEPAGWAQAMTLVGEHFAAGAACLYSLDYGERRMQPVAVTGIAPRFLGSFEAS